MNPNINKQDLIAEYTKVYRDEQNQEPIRVFFAPGRVNLIGEHTDYNGGHVFPCALTIGTYIVIQKRNDNQMLFYSMNFTEDGVQRSTIDKLNHENEKSWIDYPIGVLWAYTQMGLRINSGFQMLVYGNIPNQSGLSSSASLEVGFAYAISQLYGIKINTVDIAKMCQYSENNYNGVNCGIMDQFAIAQGKKNHAIFLDTATLKYEYVPVNLDGMKLVVTCSNKKRGLGDSKYNERRSECEHALSQLKTAGWNIQGLCELNQQEFEQYQNVITDEIERKRARHAILENQRTVTAVDLLQKNEIEAFGKLMNESHLSLKDDYEVTGIELDTLVFSAWKQQGVIGSRMTGAGFGGCTISIVKDENIDDFIKNVGKDYIDVTGYAADFFVVEIGDGPKEL